MDNIPYVATMSPIVGELVAAQGGTPQAESMWWPADTLGRVLATCSPQESAGKPP